MIRLSLIEVYTFLAFSFYFFSRAVCAAYGSSQARGQIRAVATGLPHSHTIPTAIATPTPNLSHVFDLHYNSLQRWILNPMSKARDQTFVLMDTSQVCYC